MLRPQLPQGQFCIAKQSPVLVSIGLKRGGAAVEMRGLLYIISVMRVCGRPASALPSKSGRFSLCTFCWIQLDTRCKLLGVTASKGEYRMSILRRLMCAVAILAASLTQSAAQQLAQQRGTALDVDLLRAAQQVSMQDMYARALYLHLRANPRALDDQGILVNFIIYLMTRSPKFDCQRAFGNEFEKRDFFTKALQLKEPLRQIVNSVNIPQRFDIAYTVNTAAYKFEEQSLPFTNIRAVSVTEGLSATVQSSSVRCAQTILQGTGVDTKPFPWRFSIVTESGQQKHPGFPFGNQLQIPSNDARVLFSQFGRQLYGIVSYQFQAANNGDEKIQVIPTDGQLFGLSANSVVAVKEFRHPSLSQPQYLDLTNPLEIDVAELNLEANLTFQQQGFRAVGTGTRKDPGTGITLGGSVPVAGSAAVGSSMFIMRIFAPQLELTTRYGQPLGANAEKYLTLIGAIDFEKATANQAPVSGNAIVLHVDPQSGQMADSQPMRFSGAFTPKLAPEAPEAEAIPAPSSDKPSEPAIKLDDKLLGEEL